MNREDRAKQFAPFEALNGLREALRKKELEFENLARPELSDDSLKELQQVFLKINKGDSVKVIYFEKGEKVTASGRVLKKEQVYKYFDIDGRKIYFDDICEIEIKN